MPSVAIVNATKVRFMVPPASLIADDLEKRGRSSRNYAFRNLCLPESDATEGRERYERDYGTFCRCGCLGT
jgi:hypothetical protein